MAVTIQESLQAASATGDRFPAFDRGGKLRMSYFSLPATTVTGDDGSSVNLVRLPQGKIRFWPTLSLIKVSALGASRVMDLGYRAFRKEDGASPGTDEAALLNAFLNDRDVSGATAAAFGLAVKYDFFSRAGVTLCALVAGGTIPIGATMEGFACYTQD